MDSELSQISKIELFLKAFNDWKSLTIFKKASSYIFDQVLNKLQNQYTIDTKAGSKTEQQKIWQC